VGPSSAHSIEEQVVGSYTYRRCDLMILYYRMSGIMPTSASAQLLFMMAVLAGFHATITLPASPASSSPWPWRGRQRADLRADAEELRPEDGTGRGRGGYQNALSAIVDSNITTLIPAWYSTSSAGPIRGFASPCASASPRACSRVFVTRTIFNAVIRGPGPHPEHRAGELMAGINLPFIGKYKLSFILSALLLLAAWGRSFYHKGLRTGSTSPAALLELHFDPAVTIEDSGGS